MCWSSGPMVTSSLFLHAGLAIYWITFGLVSPTAAVKLGLGSVEPSSWRGEGGGGRDALCMYMSSCLADADGVVLPHASLLVIKQSADQACCCLQMAGSAVCFAIITALKPAAHRHHGCEYHTLTLAPRCACFSCHQPTPTCTAAL